MDSPSADLRVSPGLRVFSQSVISQAEVGYVVSVSARVTEYRNPARPNDLFLTELVNVSNFHVLHRDAPVTPIILGHGNNATHRTPPQARLTSLDSGPDGWLSVPGNVTLLESVNPVAQPDKYGLDFWESLEGSLVTIPKPVVLNFPDRFGSFWVHGDWPVNGKNGRGGLTLTALGMRLSSRCVVLANIAAF